MEQGKGKIEEVITVEEQQYNPTFMKAAMEVARKAVEHGEIPVGCVLVVDGEIVASGETRVARGGPACHGENGMLESLGHGVWSIASRAVLYTNLEPCLMCLGACINAGITTIFYGRAATEDGGVRYLPGIVAAGGPVLHVVGPTISDEVDVMLRDYLATSQNAGGIEYVRTLL